MNYTKEYWNTLLKTKSYIEIESSSVYAIYQKNGYCLKIFYSRGPEFVLKHNKKEYRWVFNLEDPEYTLNIINATADKRDIALCIGIDAIKELVEDIITKKEHI